MEEEQDEGNKQTLKDMTEASDDAVIVSWVRWVPSSPFPVARLIKKYGKPDKSDFTEEDYQPFKEWTLRGVCAFLSDNEKNVLRIDYTFTEKEYQAAWKKKYGFVPAHLIKSKKKK